jgi:K+-transporting ATPase KdpF subunit
MSWENALGLAISLLVLGYLVYALFAPERLG